MKFLLNVAAVIAMAVAVPAQRGLVAPGPAGPVPAPEQPSEPIAIGPAVIDSFEPIAIGPAVIDSFEPIAIGPAAIDSFEPISVGPAIIPFPLPEGAVAQEPAVVPAPAASAPLVQIILNINQAAAESNPIAVGPAVIPEQVKPEPVQVVEVKPEPVQIVEIAPEPVQVVEIAPVPVEPIQIGVPVLPEPAVVLPEEVISIRKC